MSLIRGTKGLRLCPICLVKTTDARNLSEPFVLRTTDDTKKVYEEGITLPAGQKEKLFKENGLRGIMVCFMTI